MPRRAAATLAGVRPTAGEIEIDWPAVPGLPAGGTETVEPLPPGGYFDTAPLHLLTTATLRRFRELVPGGDFDTRRFRPNVVIETMPSLAGFVEADWAGRRLRVGDVELHVAALYTRCVMTTLPTDGLPADPRVLRAAVSHNAAARGHATTRRGRPRSFRRQGVPDHQLFIDRFGAQF